MLAQAESVISPVQFFLLAGGLPLLAFGIVFSLWGLWNVIKPPGAGWIVAQVVLSLIPGIIAMIAIYAANTEFAELATAEIAPKPAALAAVAGRSMSYGFLGLLSTIVPVLLGAIAFGRRCARLAPGSQHAEV